MPFFSSLAVFLYKIIILTLLNYKMCGNNYSKIPVVEAAMIVSTKLNKNNLYIYLDGELDQSIAGALRAQLDKYLEDVNAKNVILNLKKLSFMDSTGIGLILGRYKKLKSKNIPLFINEPSQQIDKVLKVSGLYTIIPLI